jgi:hypothetical protein
MMQTAAVHRVLQKDQEGVKDKKFIGLVVY